MGECITGEGVLRLYSTSKVVHLVNVSLRTLLMTSAGQKMYIVVRYRGAHKYAIVIS